LCGNAAGYQSKLEAFEDQKDRISRDNSTEIAEEANFGGGNG